ncbi:hypothetical protein M426DRAFT_317916 [Hypoxylon sp. CI-4A]|nr:hypothetical protein M426DRAFT_317916 [Hypoxylon sp. CI-4A]
MAARDDGTPVNLLALDGGGIRGICELRVLDEIMRRVQKVQNLEALPRPCDYFHLMAGTSTGGLIAILLSRFKLTTAEAINVYYDFSKKIFSKKNQDGFVGHLFHKEGLERIIQDMVKKHGVGELMLDPKPSAQSKAFVCTQKAREQGTAVRLRTYEPPSSRRDDSLDIPSPSGSASSSSSSSSPSSSASSSAASPLSPHPTSSMDVLLAASSPRTGSSKTENEQWDDFRDIKIWEAARATTAAPTFFPEMEFIRGDKTMHFIDGAMGCNNPADEVVDEATALYGPDCVLGCLVSLGTGYAGPLQTGKRRSIMKLVELIMAMKKMATDTENVHLGLRRRMREDIDTYFRFQLRKGTEKIGLHEYKKLDELSGLMKDYIKENSSEIDKVVQILAGNAKPKGLRLGQIAPADHGQILPPKKDIRGRPLVSEYFTGREEVLNKLADAFRPDLQRPNHKRHHLIRGQAGAGKTQTASKFLDMYGDWFEMILWVDATSKHTLNAGFEELKDCSEYGYVGNGSAKSLLWWLETTDRSWILVLDNVCEDVSDFIPRGDKGAVLFTSQNREMKPSQKSMTFLDVMSEADAVELLLSRAQLDVVVDEKKREEAAQLARDLGYLPLALEQASTTMRLKQYEISEYARLLEDQRSNLLKEAGSETDPTLQAVRASLEVTYRTLNAQAHDANNKGADAAKYALQLLGLFSFYHNEGLTGGIIKRAFLKRPSWRRQDDFGAGAQSLAGLMAADELGDWDPNCWLLGMDLLIAWSLAKRGQDMVSYSIHGLIHDWARERSPSYVRSSHARAARFVLFDSVGDGVDDYIDTKYDIKILPHARAVMDNTKGVNMDSPFEEAIHHHRLGMLLRLASTPLEAILHFKRARDIWVPVYGPTNMRALQIYRDTALELETAGRSLIAHTALTHVFVLCLDVLPKLDLFTLETGIEAAAISSRAFGWHERSERIMRDFIEVMEMAHPEHETVTSKNSLAITLFHLNRLDEARAMFIQVLLETVDCVGYRHNFYFKIANNLAVVEAKLGRLEEAHDMLHDNTMRECELFGFDRPSNSISTHNLAAIYFDQGQFEKAEEFLRWASFLSGRKDEDTFLTTVYHVHGISLTRYRQGRRQDAIEYIQWCRVAVKRFLNIDHPFVRMLRQQSKVWLDEEAQGLPIQGETFSQIQPLFRHQ